MRKEGKKKKSFTQKYVLTLKKCGKCVNEFQSYLSLKETIIKAKIHNLFPPNFKPTIKFS